MSYKVCIYNNETETVIHYPSSDKNNPHLSKMDLDEKTNDIDTFKFNISTENQGYNLLNEFTTKVKIIDTTDNSIRFTGRVLSIDEQMDSTGLFYKEVSCECALAYLLDINARNQAIMANDLTTTLTALLAKYNVSAVTENKIQLGNITAVQNDVVYQCNYESILSSIQNILKNNTNYYLQVRESTGSLFLDCLQSLSSNTPQVRLGVNMQSIIKSKDTSKLITRLIPLGANSINISSVNGGIDYIEDETAKGLYGVLEGTISYSDITDPNTLLSTAKADLSNYTQPLLTLQIEALDLSKLTGIKANEFIKGMSLHIINPVMAIDTVVKIVEIDIDLTKEYNPKLTLSNIPQTMQDVVSNLQNSSLQTDSTHHGIQIGDDFGLRAYGNSNTTEINGDTFKITRNSDNTDVLYTDEAGDITVQDITAKNMKISESFNILHGDNVVMSIGYFTSVAGDVVQIKFQDCAIIRGMDGSITITTDSLWFGQNRDKQVADRTWVNSQIQSIVTTACNTNYTNMKNWVQSQGYVSTDGSIVNLPNDMYAVFTGNQMDWYANPANNGTKIFGANTTSAAAHIPAGGAYQSIQS